MATLPTFVNHVESIWSSATTTKTVSLPVLAGDIMVIGCVFEGSSDTFTVPTNDGAALTWTQAQLDNTTVNITRLGVWTSVADTSRTIVVTGHAANGTINAWGMYGRVWRDSAGVGASNIVVNDTTANFSVGLTTTADNSAIDLCSGDWSEIVGARTALTSGVGTFTEKTNVDIAGKYFVETGYWADVGVTGAKTVGFSAPAAQTWSGIAVEIKGTAGGGPTFPFLPPSVIGSLNSQAVQRAATI